MHSKCFSHIQLGHNVWEVKHPTCEFRTMHHLTFGGQHKLYSFTKQQPSKQSEHHSNSFKKLRTPWQHHSNHPQHPNIMAAQSNLFIQSSLVRAKGQSRQTKTRFLRQSWDVWLLKMWVTAHSVKCYKHSVCVRLFYLHLSAGHCGIFTEQASPSHRPSHHDPSSRCVPAALCAGVNAHLFPTCAPLTPRRTQALWSFRHANTLSLWA